MKLEIQALCQKGIVRDNNEDMVSVGGILLRDNEMAFPVELNDNSQFYLLVADGMGGHEHGERASEGLLNFLNDCFKENVFTSENIEDELRSRVKAFSDRLNQEAEAEGQSRPMGCTLTGVVWMNGRAYLLNAGDSRTYRMRNGILRQLTTDETPRGITGDPMAEKWLLNCIGGGAEGRLTVYEITERLLDGDVLLICSDGLTDMISDESIETILADYPQSAQELYEVACLNGGKDNVSIVVAKMSMCQLVDN
jgi:protein phosphatase